MKKLGIIFVRQYRKRVTGTLVFVYEVIGDEATLKAYKESKGTFYIEDKDSKKPLYFTPRFAGKTAELREAKDKDNKLTFVVDDTVAAQIQSLVEQHGRETAEILIGGKVNMKDLPAVNAQ